MCAEPCQSPSPNRAAECRADRGYTPGLGSEARRRKAQRPEHSRSQGPLLNLSLRIQIYAGASAFSLSWRASLCQTHALAEPAIESRPSPPTVPFEKLTQLTSLN